MTRHLAGVELGLDAPRSKTLEANLNWVTVCLHGRAS